MGVGVAQLQLLEGHPQLEEGLGAVVALAVLVQLVVMVRQAVLEEQEVVVLPAPTEEEVEALVAEMEEELHREGLAEDPMVVVETQPLDKEKQVVEVLVVEQPKVVEHQKEQLVDKKTQPQLPVVNRRVARMAAVAVVAKEAVKVEVVKSKKAGKKK
jgi:hypothetical protein